MHRFITTLIALVLLFLSSVGRAEYENLEVYIDGWNIAPYDYWEVYNPIAIDETYTYVDVEVYNNSTQDVSLNSLYADGDDGGLFVTSGFSDTYLSPYQSAYFRLGIKRDRLGAGYYSGIVRFYHNEINTADPFQFRMYWTVPEIPIAKIHMNGSAWESGSNAYLTEKAPINNDYVRKTIYVRNEGTGWLYLNASSLTIDNGFEILNTFRQTSIAPGYETSFDIGFRQNGRSAGWYGGNIYFRNSDEYRDPYYFRVNVQVPDRSWNFVKVLGEHYTTKPVINWTSSYGATSYDILIDDESTCSPPYVLSYTGLTGNTLVVDQSLAHGNYHVCGIARSTLAGAPPFNATPNTFFIQQDKLFREFPDNSYTTWIPMETNSMLLHFNNDYAVNGSILPDSSANPENAVFHTNGGTNAMRNTKLANGLYLDGDRSGVTLPNTSKLDPMGSRFSMGLWFQTFKSTGVQTLYEDRGSDSGTWIKLYLIGNKLYAIVRDGSFRIRNINYGTALAANQWYQVFLTSESAVTKLYLNGQLVASATNTMGDLNMAGDDSPHIGGLAAAYSADEFNGFVDEFGFWRDVITPEKIAYAYFYQNTYHNKNNPVVTRHTSDVATFNGTNPEAIGYNAGWELKGEYTVAFSVKPENDQVAIAGKGNYMFGKFLQGVYYPIGCVYFNQTHALHGRFYCSQVKLGATPDKRTVASQYYINDGNYHHVAVSLKGTTLKLYLDGAPIALINNALTDLWGRGPFIAGGRLAADQFTGQMKNIKVYPKALTDQTIQNLSNADR